MAEVVELTQKLVRIRSENPTGNEKEVALFVKEWFSGIPGVKTELFEVKPDRPNVVARLEGESSYPRLVCLGHMDTVPAGEGWTKDPFGGTLAEGRLYGRGSSDMKGGLAAAMMAIKNAALSGKKLRESFIVCATMDEEGIDMLGALDIVERNIVKKDTFLIACEPTGLQCGVEHKGVIWYELVTKGISAHAGNPNVGADAILALGEAQVALKRAFDGMDESSVRVGRPTITFSRVEGGNKTNVVPDRARCEMDVRIPVPMTIEDITERIKDVIASAISDRKITWTLRQFNIDRPPVVAPGGSPLTKALESAFKKHMGSSLQYFGLPAYTDASIISARTGNPYGYLFGPGILELAHTADEYVPVKDLEDAEGILTDMVMNLLA